VEGLCFILDFHFVNFFFLFWLYFHLLQSHFFAVFYLEYFYFLLEFGYQLKHFGFHLGLFFHFYESFRSLLLENQLCVLGFDLLQDSADAPLLVDAVDVCVHHIDVNYRWIYIWWALP